MDLKLNVYSQQLGSPAILQMDVGRMTFPTEKVFFALHLKTLIDPRGRPTVTAGCDHYLLSQVGVSVRSSVRPDHHFSKNLTKQTTFPVGLVVIATDCGSGRGDQ